MTAAEFLKIENLDDDNRKIELENKMAENGLSGISTDVTSNILSQAEEIINDFEINEDLSKSLVMIYLKS